MTKEQILKKIELIKADLSLQIEGSVMHDSMQHELEYLKELLKKVHIHASEH